MFFFFHAWSAIFIHETVECDISPRYRDRDKTLHEASTTLNSSVTNKMGLVSDGTGFYVRTLCPSGTIRLEVVYSSLDKHN